MERLSRDEARRRVREAGMRATMPRVAVLRLLAASSRPLSHSEVVDALGDGEWDQATLYRNLVKLVDGNLARVASRVGGIARYAVQAKGSGSHAHPHFACRDCGGVQCLSDATFSVPKGSPWRDALAEAEFQVVGTCLKCRK